MDTYIGICYKTSQRGHKLELRTLSDKTHKYALNDKNE